MAEALHRLSDEALGRALRDLGPAIDVPRPVVGPEGDLASRVRARIEAAPARSRRRWWRGRSVPWRSRPAIGRPARLAVGLAVVALALLAAVAAATILGVPGIRIALFGGPGLEPGPSATARATTPTGRPLGVGAGLGTVVSLEEAAARIGFEPRLPDGLRPPDTAWLADARLTLVWAAGPDLPATALDGVGLLVTEFRGRVEDEFYQKVAGGGTIIEPVRVDDHPGYWLAGGPHFFFYVDPDGRIVDETRRWVGDTLIWEAEGVTYRIESALGRDATIGIGRSLVAP